MCSLSGPVSVSLDSAAARAPRHVAFVEVVQSYYPDIDLASQIDIPEYTASAEQALARVVDRFDARADYVRAGLALIGREAIENFFRLPYPEGRRGFVGKHTDIKIFEASSSEIFVTGKFIRSDGWPVRFAERWVAAGTSNPGEPNRVKYRETFLFDDSAQASRFEEAYSNVETHSLPDGTSIAQGTIEQKASRVNFIDIWNCAGRESNQVDRYLSKGHSILKPAAKGQ